MPVVQSSYTPPRFLAGGHLQTLYASLVRRVDFAYDRRERIDTPDDDFIDLDWANSRYHAGTKPNGSARAVVMVHGLEGSASRRYMRGMARMLSQKRPGWDVCAINLRGCSGEMNRRIQTYHSGKTDDLNLVVEHVLSQGYDAVALVGFSLGGNIVLKYLGDLGNRRSRRIGGAAAVSVPVDLASSSHKIGQRSNWHYTQYFLRSLRQKIHAKAKQHRDAVDAKPLDEVYTLRDFDDAYTAPLHGFRDASDYYRRASSKPVLSDIAVPTMLLNAANDPFLAPPCYPRSLAEGHESLTLEIPDSGGHVGFVSFNDDRHYYSEHRVATFLSRAFDAANVPTREQKGGRTHPRA